VIAIPVCVNALHNDAIDRGTIRSVPPTITSHDKIFPKRVALDAVWWHMQTTPSA